MPTATQKEKLDGVTRPKEWLVDKLEDIVEQYADNDLQREKAVRLFQEKEWLWNTMIHEMLNRGVEDMLEDIRAQRRRRIKDDPAGTKYPSNGTNEEATADRPKPRSMHNRNARMDEMMTAQREQRKWDLARMNNKPIRHATYEDVEQHYEHGCAQMAGIKNRVEFLDELKRRMQPGQMLEDAMTAEEFDALMDKYYAHKDADDIDM